MTAARVAGLAAMLATSACSMLASAPDERMADAPPLVATVYEAPRQRTSLASRRHLREARRLVRSGAHVEARGPYGRTALHWTVIGAIQSDDSRRGRAYRRVAADLLDAGAEVNAEDMYGNTPLDWCDGGNDQDLRDLLLSAGGRHGISRHLGTTLDEMLYRLYQALDDKDLDAARASVTSDIRPGTVLSLRILNDVSSRHSKPGDPIEAVVIAPATSGDRVVVPPGTPVEGTVLSASSIWTQYDQAELVLDFANLVHDDASKTRIIGIVIDVDNAREVIRDNRIVGIPFATHKTILDWGTRMLGLLPFVGFATDTALHGFASTIDREISYEAGTELKVRVRLPVRLTAPLREMPWPELSPSPALLELVHATPVQSLTASGLPSDVTNIVLLGSRTAVLAAFADAGWTEAERLGVSSGTKTFLATLWQTDYTEGPFGPLFLDERRQDLELQKQANTYTKRHHVRLWRWGSVDGQDAWVGTGSHDIGLEIRRGGTDWPHLIDPRIDRERTKVLTDLMFTERPDGYALVPRPDAAGEHNYEDADTLITDGRMLVLRLPQ